MAPELLFDPLGRRYVLLAPERAARGAPGWEPFAPDPEPCDFCGGREGRTPPETFAIRSPGTQPDTPGWSVRVVPNLYPATTVHEVVVHSPDHNVHFEDQDLAHRVDILRAYRSRISTAPTPAVVAVWNRGRSAGASRTHAHGQLFGLERTPSTLARETEAFAADPCVLCRIADDADVIADHDECRLVAHPVPFVENELLVVPAHEARFEELGDEQLKGIAQLVSEAIEKTLRIYGHGLPFNVVFHTAPRGTEAFHWHVHLMPRAAVWGGLEMGAELPIVASDPAETARRLRDA